MAGMFLNAGIIFERARAAYERTDGSGSDRKPDQMDALDAIIFSAAALEAFINETAELASEATRSSIFLAPPEVKTFASLLEEAERSRASIQMKFMLAKIALTGQTYDTGSVPYQDFALLIDLRNALLHLRPIEKIEHGPQGGLTLKPAPLLAQLRSKNILADYGSEDVIATWISTISTRAAARWACEVAAAMVQSIVDIVPDSYLKDALAVLYSKTFQAALAAHQGRG